MTLYEGRGPDDTSKDKYTPTQKLIFHIREKKYITSLAVMLYI